MMKRFMKMLITGMIAMVLFASCEKKFLEMPISNTTTVDTVFSTTTNAEQAIADVYQKTLCQGLPYKMDYDNWNAMIQSNLSGELTYGFSWTLAQTMLINGYNANGTSEDMDGFNNNYSAIRRAWLVYENIDKVHDKTMTDDYKATIKAEMKALIAYRYEQMLIAYGGVPMVAKSMSSSEDLNVKRSSVKLVLDSITTWCDQAAQVLPSVWEDKWTGRMTKAAALSVKAKALMYAARPLFNTDKPYMDFGSNSELLCLGNTDANRWATAATAAEAVITEAEGNANIGIINSAGDGVMNTAAQALIDYGTATSTPANKEVILAFKAAVNTTGFNVFMNPRTNWQAYGNVLTTNFLENYSKQDGTDQVWPKAGTVAAFSDYTTRMNDMEARFKASFQGTGIDSWNNPGDANWAWSKIFQGGYSGCAQSVKFWYKAGTRTWFDFPIFRLAAFYLSAAEAYNEMNQQTQALARLNVVRLRAGLPAVTETNQAALRKIIQREWAVEFCGENYRLHDVKHWKLDNIGNGILGGSIRAFLYNDGSAALATANKNYEDRQRYIAFWSAKQFLNPIPQSEVNKGIIIQNPGY